MKRKILSLLLTFCLALIPGLCVNAEAADAATTTTAPTPYHVDLTDYFSHDIFYDEGDTSTDIGFTGTSTTSDTSVDANGHTITVENNKIAFDRDMLKNSSYVSNEGILSASGNAITFSYGTSSYRNGSYVINADFQNDVPTLTFDVSAALKDGNSAVMMDETIPLLSTSNRDNCYYTISNVFSNRPSQYVAFLTALPNSSKELNVTIHYNDGTSEFYMVRHNGCIDSSNFIDLQAAPMYYDTTAGAEGWKQAANFVHSNGNTYNPELVACALRTHNKIVQSIDVYCLQRNWNYTSRNLNANVPILAITEIPSSDEAIETEISKYVNGGTYTELLTDDNGNVLKSKSPTGTDGVGIDGLGTVDEPAKTKEVTYEALSDNIATAEDYLKAKKAIELKAILDERGEKITDAAVLAKITKLEKQYEALKPHMVDLTDYFNRDIFAKAGAKPETDEGYINGIYTSANEYVNTAINLDDVTPLLNSDGVFSDGQIVKVKDSTNAMVATNAVLAETIYETPFDLSHIDEDRNAIVRDGLNEDNPPTWNTGVTIMQNEKNTVFSNKPADYVIILSTIGLTATMNGYTVEFTDGSKTNELQQGYSWMGEEVKNNFLIQKLGNRLYVPEDANSWTVHPKNADNNKNGFIATAIKTDGKIIKSIKVSSAYNADYKTCAPVLAITEIKDINTLSDKAKELETLVKALPANLNTTAAYQNYKKACESLEELESAGWTLDETLATKLSAYDKQYEALKPHMVDLSSYYNRDIFANEGETVTADWGFYEPTYNSAGTSGALTKRGIKADNVIPFVNSDGIFSSGTVADFAQGNGIVNVTYQKDENGEDVLDENGKKIEISRSNSITEGLASDAEMKEKAPETPFDLSGYKGNNLNAIVFDKGVNKAGGEYETLVIEQNAAKTVFSGRAADYLLILELCSNDTASKTYTITYTDGDTTVAQTAHTWQLQRILGAGKIAADFGYKVEVANGATETTLSAAHARNYNYIVASAIKLKGKEIKSVTRYGHSTPREAPLLAMTEVVSLTSTQDKVDKLDALIKEINGDVVDVTTQKKAAEAIEIASTLEKAGYSLSADTASKIAVYKKQLAGLEPHMVDLSSYFNRDIFANEGETVSPNWGYKSQVRHFKTGETPNYVDTNYDNVGINLASVEPYLNQNGILYENEVAAIVNGSGVMEDLDDDNVTDVVLTPGLASYDDVSASAIKTPFDLSHIDEDKNAIVFDEGERGSTDVITETITIENDENEKNVFSGKPSKYLLVLEFVGRATPTRNYTITYTDGTTKTQSINYHWSGQIDVAFDGFFDAGEVLYTESEGTTTILTEKGGSPYWNRGIMVASAIPTENKTIKSVTREGHNQNGSDPLLALTEIPLDYKELKEDLELAWDGTYTNENADSVIKRSEAGIELYNRGYTTTVSERWYNTYLAANKKAKAIKAVGVDKIYAVNEFSDDGTNVTANVTLTNTSSDDKNYILVIAAYSENGEKLLNLNYGKQTTLTSEGIGVTDLVSIPVNSEATSYKVFVWESLSSLKPIVTFTK